MQEFSYTDPYDDDLTVLLQVDDEDAEKVEEIVKMLNENTRKIKNLEAKERKHTAYHFEGMTYEGEEYGTGSDIIDQVSDREEDRKLNEWLYENLTEVQYRRFMLFMYDIPIREIARKEGVDYSSVEECIRAAQKKLKKNFQKHPIKKPF